MSKKKNMLKYEIITDENRNRTLDAFAVADPFSFYGCVPSKPEHEVCFELMQRLIQQYSPRGIVKDANQKSGIVNIRVQYDNQAFELSVLLAKSGDSAGTYEAELRFRNRSGERRPYWVSSKINKDYKSAVNILNTHSKKTGKFFKPETIEDKLVYDRKI